MLRISEHYEYYHKDHLLTFKQLDKWEAYFASNQLEDSLFFSNDVDRRCVSVNLRRNQVDDTYFCSIHSTYYVGLDRFPHFDLPVYIAPKLNNDEIQVDYVNILLDCLKEPDNFDHLDGLIDAKFENDWIEIDNELQPLLTPFLIVQFLSLVKGMVKKGLKKSYYVKIENFNNRIKGKVLVGQQIKQNLLKNRLTHTFCQFQEFGLDSPVNQFLKFVLSQVSSHLDEFVKSSQLYKDLKDYLNYCNGGFGQVSDHKFMQFQFRESNPFYKEYNQAIRLGNQILALKDFNISKNYTKNKVKHPAFWIDMSKLFELFVFRKLKERFPGENEVKYHYKVNSQEPDFILNTSCGIKAIVDAKYKPRYNNGDPTMEDARQLAGYTRLNNIYKELNINDNILIPAYFIYPSNLPKIKSEEKQDDFRDFEDDSFKLFNTSCRESRNYRKMYMQEVVVAVKK